MISTLVKNNGNISITSRGRGGIGGSIISAKPHPHGGYYIDWWYGIGACFEYVGDFLNLISIAKSEERRIMRPHRFYFYE